MKGQKERTNHYPMFIPTHTSEIHLTSVYAISVTLHLEIEAKFLFQKARIVSNGYAVSTYTVIKEHNTNYHLTCI